MTNIHSYSIAELVAAVQAAATLYAGEQMALKLHEAAKRLHSGPNDESIQKAWDYYQRGSLSATEFAHWVATELQLKLPTATRRSPADGS